MVRCGSPLTWSRWGKRREASRPPTLLVPSICPRHRPQLSTRSLVVGPRLPCPRLPRQWHRALARLGRGQPPWGRLGGRSRPTSATGDRWLPARLFGSEWPSPASGRPSSLVAALGSAVGLGWLRAARDSWPPYAAEVCGMAGGRALSARAPGRPSRIGGRPEHRNLSSGARGVLGFNRGGHRVARP